MGYSAHAQVVFGLMVKKEAITVEEHVRSCEHDTDLNGNFCSVCGKPVYQTEETMLVEYGYSPNKIAYFVRSSNNDEKGILGFVLAQGSDYDPQYHTVPTPSEKLVKALKDFLIKHNIPFQENNFKTYLYLS